MWQHIQSQQKQVINKIRTTMKSHTTHTEKHITLFIDANGVWRAVAKPKWFLLITFDTIRLDVETNMIQFKIDCYFIIFLIMELIIIQILGYSNPVPNPSHHDIRKFLGKQPQPLFWHIQFLWLGITRASSGKLCGYLYS